MESRLNLKFMNLGCSRRIRPPAAISVHPQVRLKIKDILLKDIIEAHSFRSQSFSPNGICDRTIAARR